MENFFPAVFDSFLALFSAEPVLYIISLMGLSFVFLAIRVLTGRT